MAEESIRIEVVYAEPGRRWLIELDVSPGTTAGEAIRSSGILEARPGLDTSSIGIFGEHVEPDRLLEDGDRVEIYRPLVADPKDVRRELARLGKSMGRRR